MRPAADDGSSEEEEDEEEGEDLASSDYSAPSRKRSTTFIKTGVGGLMKVASMGQVRTRITTCATYRV